MQSFYYIGHSLNSNISIKGQSGQLQKNSSVIGYIQYLTTKDALKTNSKTIITVVGSRQSHEALACCKRRTPDAGTISSDA